MICHTSCSVKGAPLLCLSLTCLPREQFRYSQYSRVRSAGDDSEQGEQVGPLSMRNPQREMRQGDCSSWICWKRWKSRECMVVRSSLSRKVMGKFLEVQTLAVPWSGWTTDEQYSSCASVASLGRPEEPPIYYNPTYEHSQSGTGKGTNNHVEEGRREEDPWEMVYFFWKSMLIPAVFAFGNSSTMFTNSQIIKMGTYLPCGSVCGGRVV